MQVLEPAPHGSSHAKVVGGTEHSCQRPSLQPAGFAFDTRLTTEADQLAFDAPARGERARQLERVAFAAAK